MSQLPGPRAILLCLLSLYIDILSASLGLFTINSDLDLLEVCMLSVLRLAVRQHLYCHFIVPEHMNLRPLCMRPGIYYVA